VAVVNAAGLVALAFLVGILSGVVVGVLVGALIADTLSVRRHRRRREQIDIEGTDAIEAWMAGMEWPRRPTNGSPWPEEEQAA
jgi:hypothetical protein